MTDAGFAGRGANFPFANPEIELVILGLAGQRNAGGLVAARAVEEEVRIAKINSARTMSLDGDESMSGQEVGEGAPPQRLSSFALGARSELST